MDENEDSLDIEMALDGIDDNIAKISEITLDDAINEMIDGALKKIRIYDDSIDTNGKVKKLLMANIIQLDKVNEFIDTLSKYNNSIIDATEDLVKYLQFVKKGDRKNSDFYRNKIEKILSNSSEGQKGMTFTEIINEEFKKAEELSVYFSAIKSIEKGKDILEIAYTLKKFRQEH